MICNLTGFTPEYSLEQGLVETMEWFLKPENLKKYKAGVYNVEFAGLKVVPDCYFIVDLYDKF